MIKLKELELKIKEFREDIDYSLISKPQERIYCFFSEEIKKAVSPFPREELEGFMIVSRKKTEKDATTGEYFIYEENTDGSEFDKLVIVKKDSNSEVDKRIKEIDKIDERIKEIDAIPSGSGPTFSYTVRKFNEKGEVIRENKKISSEPPSTAEIREITDQEAKQIEKNKNKQMISLKNLENTQSTLVKQENNELVNQQKTKKIALISLLVIGLVSVGGLLVKIIKNGKL
jgi:predicted RND superfamily exporter protein